jgi:peptide deformylase
VTARDTVQIPAPVLARPAERVGEIDDRVRGVCADLLDTVRASNHSVGVAAPQIGVSMRAFCVDVTGHPRARSCHGELVLVNPEIVLAHGRDIGREGCMSVPDLTGDVARHTLVVVRGLTPDGEERVLECDAFEARAVQHELDHLDGAVFLDRLVSADRVFRRKRYR